MHRLSKFLIVGIFVAIMVAHAILHKSVSWG
jgi:hypothetical protein